MRHLATVYPGYRGARLNRYLLRIETHATDAHGMLSTAGVLAPLAGVGVGCPAFVTAAAGMPTTVGALCRAAIGLLKGTAIIPGCGAGAG